MDRLRARLRFLRSLSKGLSRGSFFPDRFQPPPAPAPEGTVRTERAPLGNQAGGFVRVRHSVVVPGLTSPLRAWHLTDIHVRSEGPWLDQLCQRLSALEPADLVLLTGDVLTTGWTQGAARQLLDALPAGRLGRFAVLGNWEHWAGAVTGPWPALLDAHGIQLLRNRTAAAGPVDVLGTDDHLAGTLDLAACLRGRREGHPTLALTHSPAAAPTVARCGVSLILAGHSHSGQVRLPGLGALWVPMGTGRYVGGWYRVGDTPLFVGNGVGWSIAPVRLACAPELVELRLLPA